MNKLEVIIIFSAALICCVFGAREDDRWVWTQQSQDKYQPRPFHDSSAKYQVETWRRNARARNREPTTRKPLPGQPPNDEIEDYDDDVNTNVATRDYPFPPFGGQLFGTNFYPNVGGAFGGATGNGNGILVGPGGPTGVIGRPQPEYPGGYNGQPGAGFPAQPGVYGGGNALGAGGQFGQPGGGGYSGAEGGINPAFGGQFGGGVGQFPGGQGGQYPVGGQYPIGGQYPGGAQYPGTQFQGNQFPAAQYPGAGGPQYTEGYGLASTGGGFPGYVQYNAGGPFGFGNAFNDAESGNRKLKVEGKTLEIVESRKRSQQQVDDKINKGLTKVQH